MVVVEARRRRCFASVVGALLATACTPDDPEAPSWQLVHPALPSALLSVWGTSATDVWAVGGDLNDGDGPLVIRYDGERWLRVDTGLSGDLWWVFGFDDGPVYVGGAGGLIARDDGGSFTTMDTPGDQTVFGIWGASEGDMWAVGGASDASGGFAWRLEGDRWVEEPSLPPDVPADAAIWKIFGTARDDAWLVGSNGVALHWDGSALAPADTGVGSSLFTVHARDGRYVAVGGLATGIIVELEGDTWENATPDPAPMGLSGVTLGADGTGVAVGLFGGIVVRDGAVWNVEDPGFGLPQNLHGSWIDEDGGLWAVGGQTLATPPTDGVLIHRGYTPIADEEP